MTKWEYLQVTIQQHQSGPGGKTSYIVYENSKKISGVGKSWQKWAGDVHTCPNYYGKKGWELIKMSNGPKWFLFRRQTE